ncbi:type II toxin-antitoxin system mRNA interferase toxin, RelE/StbE family [Yersinia frederiksenii]|uniref:type II toxin-antitoxin system mRNA interferase toxin, RelE/StbE family n=1 Tax=Yersinia frederiksenii TaxID=29484 RepID=UPI0009B6B0BF|nr:type II toxin-antitoxin system mRNA interferase toxin, RelE/StbE family [Yersinia frederiksenii]ATM97871.1 type II toxin-antitoxin system mRNA interferase toxin, RelE/StbE family [Yersinia frederiksenii]
MSYLLNLNKTTVSQRTTMPRTADYTKDFRECHVGGDFLLIYKLSNHGKINQIVFVRTGTHAELFE